MNCDEVRNHLVEYLLLHISDAELVSQIKAHIADCSACSWEAVEAGRVLGIIKSDDAVSARLTRASYLILEDAINNNATHVHIEDNGTGSLDIRFRIGGRLQRYEKALDITADMAGPLIAKLKAMFNVDIYSDTATGAIPIQYHDVQMTVYSAFYKTAWGRGVVLKLAASPSVLNFKKTELSESERELVKGVLNGKPGLIVLAGIPADSLRNTRLAIVSYLSAGGLRSVRDIEKLTPVQWLTPSPIANVTNISMGDDVNSNIENVLLLDPDVISIADVPNIEEAAKAVEFAEQGHFVLLQMVEDTSYTDQTAIEDKLFNSSLRLAIAHSLRLIIHHKPVGSSQKQDVFQIDNTASQRREILLAEGISENEIKALIGDEIFRSFSESAQELIDSGLISLRNYDVAEGRAFSPEVAGILERARGFASLEQSEFHSEYLLRAMLEDESPALRKALEDINVDVQLISDEIVRHASVETSKSQAVPYPSPRVIELIAEAARLSEPGLIYPAHLLQAMLSSQGLAGEVLKRAVKTT